jgi:hypothetical protein
MERPRNGVSWEELAETLVSAKCEHLAQLEAAVVRSVVFVNAAEASAAEFPGDPQLKEELAVELFNQRQAVIELESHAWQHGCS